MKLSGRTPQRRIWIFPSRSRSFCFIKLLLKISLRVHKQVSNHNHIYPPGVAYPWTNALKPNLVHWLYLTDVKLPPDPKLLLGKSCDLKWTFLSCVTYLDWSFLLQYFCFYWEWEVFFIATDATPLRLTVRWFLCLVANVTCCDARDF